MFGNAHGLRIDLVELSQRRRSLPKGAVRSQPVRHARALNFATRPLRLELDEMNQLQLPCMLHWNLNHFGLKQLGPMQYRALIGTVMQNDALMAGSLSENIACFDPQLDHARVEAVARLTQIHEEIAVMPMAYQTLVGDMGSTLSGGQKQRVLLARALYKQPKILALDEATSSLDTENERQVNIAVKALPLTRITIAHRRETINAARRVVVLNAGAVIRDVRAA